jgi:hypothetical protein
VRYFVYNVSFRLWRLYTQRRNFRSARVERLGELHSLMDVVAMILPARESSIGQ